MRFIVTTSPGFEELLSSELTDLGLEPLIEHGQGAVSFEGGWPEAARVLLESRIASRILLSLKIFSAKNSAMLYDQTRRIEWDKLLANAQTMAVYCHGSTEGTNFTINFAPLKIKDAICDEVKKLGQDRPNIDKKKPHARIHALIHQGKCELSMDLSGSPMHRRGYREEDTEAPLRENRAAALLRFSGYDGTRPLVDPFCGSGTILIEGALIAQKKAPGLLKTLQSLSIWRLFPEARPALEEARNLCSSKVVAKPAQRLTGWDISKKNLESAKVNARKAGVEALMDFRVADARELAVSDVDIVTNPPYGERLGDVEEAVALLSNFTRQLKHHCEGTRFSVVIPKGPLEKAVGLRSSRKMTFTMGPIESRFLQFELFKSARK